MAWTDKIALALAATLRRHYARSPGWTSHSKQPQRHSQCNFGRAPSCTPLLLQYRIVLAEHCCRSSAKLLYGKTRTLWDSATLQMALLALRKTVKICHNLNLQLKQLSIQQT